MTSHYTETKAIFDSPLPSFESAGVAARKAWRAVRSTVTAVLDTKVCGDMDVVGCVLLSGFVAIVVHPLVYGNLGTSIVALMTPVR